MKNFLTVLILAAVVAAGSFTADAKAPVRKKAAARKSASSVLPVTKGETRQYGDYLVTQQFRIKKGKDNSISVEYPIEGTPELVNALRKEIKERVNPNFTGSLDTPEAMLRSAMKNYRDVSFGDEGESLTEEISVMYATPEVVTLQDAGYTYMGGAHGLGFDTGVTFMVQNGSKLTAEMMPDIKEMRPVILKNIARGLDIPVKDLNEVLFDAQQIEYPATVFVTKDGLNFAYQPYEIAPYSAGVITAVVPTSEVIGLLSPEAQKFLK